MNSHVEPVEGAKPMPNGIGCLPNGNSHTIGPAATLIPFNDATLGRHIARRLVQVGVTDVFTVPGYFNLTLLDHLIAEPGLNNVGCCNELNAGYAADGYARSRGVGACVVTFTVGGLSILNAIAGAYSENLPVICIVGGPNSNDYGTNRNLHHTIGLPDFTQELRCFQTVTCFQAVVKNLEDAHELIDTAISTALKESKPVYISISCNLVAIPHPTFSREPVPFALSPRLSNPAGLEAAVEAAATFLNNAVKPVLYGSIGWSVGAALGYAQAAKDKRVIACIGDGSFQVSHIPLQIVVAGRVIITKTSFVFVKSNFLHVQLIMSQVAAQDMSTMLRCGQNSIIFLINNGGYTAEVEIHDGPYNVIKNWNYAALVDAIHNGYGKCWTTKVRCEEDLKEAIATATRKKEDCLCFIEVMAHKDDTSKELLEWGSRVSAASSRPPNPQQ
ncbi:hypothetical protein Taro_055657 [Colocasia esculenta]|uniref:pyruvate decarboxylase n=1 Tax=Colocasia esculenta TaxID=4460 RepID=A0A843XTY6_COLES|nr:hypothetical protein [Colocasia esculenta]